MNPLKLVSTFVLLLVMSGGFTILGVNQAYASCCNPWRPLPNCTKYSAMVFGSAKPLNEDGTTFLIKDDKGFFKELKASQDFIDQYNQFKMIKEKETSNGKTAVKELNGFSILNTNESDELMLIAFVPSTLDHQSTHLGAGASAKRYNKLFEQVASPPTLHPYKKVTGASMTTR
jgi:hypothetical protein